MKILPYHELYIYDIIYYNYILYYCIILEDQTLSQLSNSSVLPLATALSLELEMNGQSRSAVKKLTTSEVVNFSAIGLCKNIKNYLSIYRLWNVTQTIV